MQKLASSKNAAITAEHKVPKSSFLTVNAILVDDNRHYTDVVAMLNSEKSEKIYVFNDALSVIHNLPNIPTTIKFYLDHNLGAGMDGAKLAEFLYQQGYHQLYMISGYAAADFNLPFIKGYIDKSDII